MSPLAMAVYRILRKQAAVKEPRISYAALAEKLRDISEVFANIYPRSQSLYAALREVGTECRRLKLPCLPALVVRSDTRRPGEAYWSGSKLRFRGERIEEWRREVNEVKQARYPKM